jgi:signal transduction histidine kinase
MTEANDVSTRTSTPVPPRNRRGRRKGRLSLRNARIRAKLGLLLVIPVVAIVSLAAVGLVDSYQRVSSARLVSALADLSADVAGLTHDLEQERMAAATVLAPPRPRTETVLDTSPGAQKGATVQRSLSNERSHQVDVAGYEGAIKETDAAITAYTNQRGTTVGLPSNISDRLDRVDGQLGNINALRQSIREPSPQNAVSISKVVLRYTVTIQELVGFHTDISPLAGDNAVADSIRALAAFEDAKVRAAEVQALAFAGLSPGPLDQDRSHAIQAALTAWASALGTFALNATPDQRAVVDATLTGNAMQLAEQQTTLLQEGFDGTATIEDQAFGAVVALMRYADKQLEAQLSTDANELTRAGIRAGAIEGIAVLITLVLAIVIALFVARSMARSLSRLREGALSVVNRDLPEAVSRLRDVRELGENSPEQIAAQVRDPIRLSSRDEIGQVAVAFNRVHREAVRVAAEQAALRISVSAMFLNLARRSQTLVDRIIGELDDIERSEEDPKRLARLFQLDHLATRMRRNDENLLILSGADSSPPRREDALLVDVARAAQSEVEQYNRIEFATVDQDVSIAAHVVNDVVRLLAELLDNSTRFSPPQTAVVLDARRIGDYVLIQIEDRGLGMTGEQMAMLNDRLARPPIVDVTSFRMMGLAVVGRLANRHGIKVELRPNPDGGTITTLTMPTRVLILPRLRGREAVASRPRSPLAVERGPSSFAAPPAYPQNGWPMPQLPGLAHADGRSVQPTGTATLNGWAQPPEPNGGWPGISAAASSVPVATSAEALGYSTGSHRPVQQQHVDDTTELPIFRAMEAVWFRSHTTSDEWSASAFHGGRPANVNPTSAVPMPQQPPAGYLRNAPYVPAAAAPPPPPPPPPPPSAPLPPRRPADYDESWRTAADDGWRAAAAASQPSAAGTTRSGLPKRVPSAQLVPGGVETPSARSARRTPEEVRGLLSAYHRGVQRGRAGGDDRSRTGTEGES